MERLPQLLRHTSACLCCILLALLWCCTGTAQAAEASVAVDKLKEVFSPLAKDVETEEMSVRYFSAGNLHCVALVDSRQRVHHIFLLPRKDVRSEADAAAFREETGRMHRYVATLATAPEHVRLIPFNPPAHAAVLVCMPEDRRTSFSRSVLGAVTLSVVDTAFNCGAKPESLENGELTLLFPSKENASELCALVISLHKGTVDVLGFSPPPSKGKKEETAVASLVQNLRIVRSNVDAKPKPDALQAAARQTGAPRCFTRAGENAIVLFNKKLYAGSLDNLRRYIKERKKDTSAGGFLGEFTFPTVSHPIPASQSADSDDSGDSTDTTGSADATPSSSRSQALKDYLKFLKRLQKQ